jgi:polyribonucleotide nucleotidyltransferase
MSREFSPSSQRSQTFGRGGLVHVSELAPRRVAKVSDVVNEGDMVKVKLLGFDNRGKVRLSMKQVDQQTGENLSKKQAEEHPVAEASGE